jgi:hypothetical protein
MKCSIKGLNITMKLKYKLIAFPIFIIFTFLSCNTNKVSKNELMDLTNHWKEPKVASWYYMGADDNYNYFVFQDLGFFNVKYYKVIKLKLLLIINFHLLMIIKNGS